MDTEYENSQQVIIAPPSATLLASFGSRAELREMSHRIKTMLRMTDKDGNTRAYTEQEALMLAAVSLAHGLDPINREVWLLLDNKGVPQIYTGPAAYEKAAQTQITAQGGGNWWAEYRPITDPDERAMYAVPAGAYAFKAILYDTPTHRTYTDTIKVLTAAGAKWEQITAIVGEKPYTEGIGIYLPTPMTKTQDSKWSPALRAQKRALHAALKRRFTLPFVGESDGNLPSDFVGPYAVTTTTGPNQPTSAAETVVDGQPGQPHAPVEQEMAQAPASTAPEPEPDGFDSPTNGGGQPAPAATAPAPRTSPIWQKWEQMTADARAIGLTPGSMDPAASNDDVAAAMADLAKQMKAQREKAKTNLFGDGQPDY